MNTTPEAASMARAGASATANSPAPVSSDYYAPAEDNEQRLEVFARCGALQTGHFVLSSGKHSSHYLQCAKVCQQPAVLEQVCHAVRMDLAKILDTATISEAVIVSPAIGAMLFGYELARASGGGNIFAERPHGEFELRRGFELEAGQPVIVAEDVITTGGSVREIISLVQSHGAEVKAVAALAMRCAHPLKFNVPLVAYARLVLPLYDADALPPQLANMAVSKPGSRGTR